jgi:hypothetical protein
MSERAKKKRSAEETWKAIEREADLDEMNRIINLSDKELDAELRAAGFDPEEEARKTSELIDKLKARHDREAPHAADLAHARARLAARRARRVKRPRAELKDRIAIAQKDPRLPKSASVHFRNHNEEEASDEELADLLDALEDLIEQHEEEKKADKGS